MRKSALRQISDKAREFGAGPLFNQILPLLMSPTLEDQERHLLVKVIDRVMYKLDELVRPYVHKILVVIEPLLIDKDYYARVEGNYPLHLENNFLPTPCLSHSNQAVNLRGSGNSVEKELLCGSGLWVARFQLMTHYRVSLVQTSP